MIGYVLIERHQDGTLRVTSNLPRFKDRTELIGVGLAQHSRDETARLAVLGRARAAERAAEDPVRD